LALTPATYKQLELAFQQCSQSHTAPSVPVTYVSCSEVKVEENGHGSVGSNSSMSEGWVLTSKQQLQQGNSADYAVSSSGFAGAAAAHAKKSSNRPTGPRKLKPQVLVSTV